MSLQQQLMVFLLFLLFASQASVPLPAALLQHSGPIRLGGRGEAGGEGGGGVHEFRVQHSGAQGGLIAAVTGSIQHALLPSF